MDKVGRNDPCPCGSGRKYKNCCLNRDRNRRIQESAWRRDEQTALDKLLDFAQRPEFGAQFVVAFNLFWNGAYGLEGLDALERHEVARFLDWYVYDYRLESVNKRLIDLFMEEMATLLSPPDRERVRAWQDSYLSVYRITGAADEASLSVVDALQGEAVAVSDTGLGRLGLLGDLIVGRVLRSSASPHFSWSAILLPAEMEAGIVEFMTRGYSQYRETHLSASWPDFLSHSGYLLNHYLLKSAAEAGRARYAGRVYYDAYRTVEALQETKRRLLEQATKRAEELRRAQQPGTEPKGDTLRQTKGGVLLPGHVRYKGSKETH